MPLHMLNRREMQFFKVKSSTKFENGFKNNFKTNLKIEMSHQFIFNEIRPPQFICSEVVQRGHRRTAEGLREEFNIISFNISNNKYFCFRQVVKRQVLKTKKTKNRNKQKSCNTNGNDKRSAVLS